MCRTVVIGKKPEGYDNKYAILQDAMARGQAAAVPVSKCPRLPRSSTDHFANRDMVIIADPRFMRVRGPRFGHYLDLPGDVAVTNDIVLEEGMMFVMHPNQYLPETAI